jgi:ABC-type Fe3+-siderophore transport system permease subunit
MAERSEGIRQHSPPGRSSDEGGLMAERSEGIRQHSPPGRSSDEGGLMAERSEGIRQHSPPGRSSDEGGLMTAIATAAPAKSPTVRRRNRHYLSISLLVVCLVATFVALMIGTTVYGPGTVLRALTGASHDDTTSVIIKFELPRVLLCWLVGIGLGVSGGVMQAVIRNSLAAPNIIGVTKGAGLAAVLVVLALPTAPAAMLPVAAFVGGVGAFGIVYLVAYRGNSTTPARLALVGVAVSAMCEAGILFFLVRYPLNVSSALIWLSGSLYGRTMQSFWEILPWVVVLVPLLLYYARRLDTLGLGDDLAAGLGEPVERTRRLTLLISVALASAVVAAAGTVGFVGLVAPHIARRLVGSKHSAYLPVAALLGTLMMLVADTIARGLIPPLEIPSGLVTSIIGAPYFLYLLAKTGKAGAR